MKGYTYQQETSRQVGLEAMKNGGGSISGMAGDAMQLGVGLGTVGSVINMTKDAIQPVMQNVSSMAQPAPVAEDSWICSCGQANITSKFCPNCGSKKPEAWDCTCGEKGITSKFCPNCGNKKPENWDCSCGTKNIASKFCPNCGSKKLE